MLFICTAPGFWYQAERVAGQVIANVGYAGCSAGRISILGSGQMAVM